MTAQEMRIAVEEAKRTLENADSIVNNLACILQGRLRQVHTWRLKQLKAELSRFNAKTQEWKE